jgi:WD40 repeat protein
MRDRVPPHPEALPMRANLIRLPVLAAAIGLAISGGSRPPFAAAQEPKQEPKDDPLPKGAKVRLGGVPTSFRYVPAYSLLPPDYKTVLLADLQGGLRRYDVTTGRALDKQPDGGFGGPVVASRDGKRLLIGQSAKLTVRDAATGQAVQELQIPPGLNPAFTSLASLTSLSSDGKVAAQGAEGKDRKGEVVVWDVDKGEIIARVETLQKGSPVPVLSADGKLLATRPLLPPFAAPGGKVDPDQGRTVQVWGVETGKELFKARVTGTSVLVSAVAFSPDGRLLAASCGDGPIDLWEVPGGKLKMTLLGRVRQGVRVAFSPDGKTVAAVSIDGTVQRWNAADGKMLATTEGPSVFPFAVSLGLEFADNDRVLAWGSLGSFPLVWEAPSGKVISRLPEHTQPIKCIAFAAGGKEVITAGVEGRIVRWDATTGKAVGEVKLRPSRAITVGAFRPPMHISPDGTRVITQGNPAAVYDLATGTELFAIPPAPLSGTYQMQTVVSADMTKVMNLSINFDVKKTGVCVAWDLAAQKKLGEVELVGPIAPAAAAAMSPSGTRLVTAGYVFNPGVPQTLVITGWDLKTGKRLGQVEDTNATGQVFVAAASESSAIVSTATGGRVRRYDYEAGKVGDEIEWIKARAADAAGPVVFSADGKRFAVAIASDERDVFAVRVYDWPSVKPLHTFTGHRTPVTALAFSPDGKTLASGSQDTTVILWDMSMVKGE